VRIALDTNVLVYAEGVDDGEKESIASRLTDALPPQTTILSAQVLGELYNVLVRRGRSRHQARRAAEEWAKTFFVIPTSCELMLGALELATEHRLYPWDALILAAAAEARCELLLSEDFQDGFAWHGVTVANPFAVKPHPKLASLLRA
jgi:predicted nucleic acid-binding protein